MKIKQIKLKKEDFNYLNENQLPCAVLGIHLNRFDSIYNQYGVRGYKFKLKDFQNIAHQTGGISCGQHYIQGRILHLRPKYDSAIDELSRKYYDLSLGCFGNSLKELNEYNDFLVSHFGEYCLHSYENLEEGIYPIDINEKTLHNLVSDKLPKNLDDLICFQSKFDKFCGSYGRWSLFILTENSD